MLGNYLSTAWRQTLAQPLHAFINVAGLAIGLACFVLITLFVQYERGFDSHWRDADRIYRISRDVFETVGRTEAHPAGMPGPAAPRLAADFREIERAARIDCCGGLIRTPDGEPQLEPALAMADNELFEIFDFEWLRGDPATALTRPDDVVLTRSAAQRHFGDLDAMGRLLEVGGGAGGWAQLTVVGVIEDLPPDSHLDFSMLESMLSYTTSEGALEFLNDWDNNIFHTYVLLREGAEASAIQDRAAEFFERNVAEGAGEWTSFTVMPVTDVHLQAEREGEMRPGGNRTSVYSFSAIAAFVLLLACINFMNLATASATRRAREVGVRKAVGAERSQLVVQFLIEFALLALLATAIGIMLVELALPAFNDYVGRNLAFGYLGDPAVIGGLAALWLVTGLVAGSYPAAYLSAFRPARVLRDEAPSGRRAAMFRKGLVVLQFAIAIALMIGTGIVYEQLRFVHDIELGFDPSGVVIIEPNPIGGAQWEALKTEWLSHPGVASVTASDVVPFERDRRTAEIRAPDSAARARMRFMSVDHDFFATYGIDVVAGRAFSRAFGSDAPGKGSAFVINELAARELGWTAEQAIGRPLELGDVQGSRFFVEDASGPVVGIVDDVLFESAHAPIAPTVYRSGGGAASIKLTGRDVEDALAHIDDTWKAFSPVVPLSRRFLEQDLEALYRAERQQAQAFALFSALAVVIGCLGLFGMASFATERRTKEIGIRKAMGGSVLDVVRLLVSEFSALVLIANLLAWPAAYYVMRRWLGGFAYRIDLGLDAFVAGGAIALGVACMTVSATAVRAASAKPVDSLRYE